MMSVAMAKHVNWKRSIASFNTTVAAGKNETKHTAKALFTLLPEFSESKIIHWEI
jgi:hypothetical protein